MPSPRSSRSCCATYAPGDGARQAAAIRLLVSHLGNGPLAVRHRAALERLEAAGRFDVVASAVDLHRVALTYVTNKKGGDQILSALPGIADRQHRDFGPSAVVDVIRTDLISGGVESGTVEAIVRKAEMQFDPSTEDVEDVLRMIVATSAVSHGVDVENFNAMFFAGMPTAIDEFIQASSRVGRTHVGFSMLIPTPQNRRDRFIFEVHETFHRFLERMIAPPAIERWADRAIVRVVPSVIQNWLIGKIYQEQFVADSDPEKKRARIFSKVSYVRSLVNRMKAASFIDDLEEYIAGCIGLDAQVGGAEARSGRSMTAMVRDRLRGVRAPPRPSDRRRRSSCLLGAVPRKRRQPDDVAARRGRAGNRAPARPDPQRRCQEPLPDDDEVHPRGRHQAPRRHDRSDSGDAK